MPTSLAAMLALFNDNTSGDISAADGRAVIQALYDWIPVIEKYKAGRLAGETAHADDDFFSTLTGYTDVDVTGTSTWSATRGGASCVFAGQSAGDFSALLKPIPVAGVPITIETYVSDLLQGHDNPMWAVGFTNGVASTSSLAAFGRAAKQAAVAGATSNHVEFTGTVGTMATTLLTSNGMIGDDLGRPLFVRLTWKSANTFAWSISVDSEVWTDFGRADFSSTFTPTHMGFFVSAFSQTGPQAASFRYLRVYEADLSV